jgi:uncharacterized membrane protein YcgQ (UPF0703/DUF1980 family)
MTEPRSRIGAFAPWLDVGAIAAWGLLMINYWLSGKLNLLIHPNYIALVVAGGLGLLAIALFKGWILFTGKTPGMCNIFPFSPWVE